jgi:dolichol-phosphate mannosyltransferase
LTRRGVDGLLPAMTLAQHDGSPLDAPGGAPTAGAPELCVVVPTFNERDNVPVLAVRLASVLDGIAWEAVFVDDNSPDGTADAVRSLARSDPRIRCLRRIDRRGLSSACIEGILSTSAPFIAVIDGDLQHDEALLPQMLRRLQEGPEDLAIASRYVGAGRADGLSSQGRKQLSRAGARLARMVTGIEVSDPVSGFFMLRREVIDLVAPRLSGVGTKILIDILTASPRPLSMIELPYQFSTRHAGESKLDALVALEYAMLLAEKLSGRVLSHKLLLFGLVGATGVIVNLAALRLLLGVFDVGTGGFVRAEIVATALAMVSNFFLNNMLTYRDRRLTGWQAVRGLISFIVVCSLGALVNIAIARDIYAETGMWLLAGIAGAVTGALVNYSLTSVFTWRRRF